MRVRVVINNVNMVAGQKPYSYEAESILFTRTIETFEYRQPSIGIKGQEIEMVNTKNVEVPALIVLHDSGEYEVQPLVIQNGTVKVFQVKQKPSLWKRLKGHLCL